MGQWTLPKLIVHPDMDAEPALDMGFYIFHSRVYPCRLYEYVPDLIVVNLEARYFGMPAMIYV